MRGVLPGRALARRLWVAPRARLADLRAATAARLAARRPRTPRQVVFVSDYPRSREAKLAYGLQQAGWQVVLLHRRAPTFDAHRSFSEVRAYRDPLEALFLCARYTPVAYHVFSSWNFDVAATLIRYRPGKVVFDDYDVMAGMVQEDLARKHNPGQLELERYCLEQADGLCCRSLEPQFVRRKLGYRFRGKVIFFPEYCWDRPQRVDGVGDRVNGDLHLVYCGHLNVEKLQQVPAHGEGFYLDFARDLAHAGVHFHLYPATIWLKNFDDAFSEHQALAEETSYFHLHRPMPADELVLEMTGYHLGVLTSRGEILAAGDGVYNPEKYVYCMSNKLFDYIDAGLGVVIDERRLQRWLMQRLGIAVTAARDEVADIVPAIASRLDRDFWRRVERARTVYSVRRQAPRLARFYVAL